MLFHELTGINVIVLYSNTIFKEMNSSGNALVSPRQGVILTGLVNFLASLISTQVVRFFGRKTLLLWGQIGMTIVHTGVAIFNIFEIDIGVVAMVMLFMFIFQNTSGPIAWVYCSETTIDAGMGVNMLVLWGTVFLLSLICPLMMDPESGLGPTITFLAFGGTQLLGFLYVLLFIKETAHLSDRDKKLLFTPQMYKGGRLDDNSEHQYK